MTNHTLTMTVHSFDTPEDARAFRDALADAFAAMPESDGLAASFGRGWQPIETAPKDGIEVLLLTPGGVAIGIWEDREDDSPDQPGHNPGWYANGYSCDPVMWGRTESHGFLGPGYLYEEQNQPTHWMPLPSPPTTTEGNDDA